MRGYKLTFFGLLLLAVALNVFVLFAAYTGNDVIDFRKWTAVPDMDNLEADFSLPGEDRNRGRKNDLLNILDDAKSNIEKASESLGK